MCSELQLLRLITNFSSETPNVFCIIFKDSVCTIVYEAPSHTLDSGADWTCRPTAPTGGGPLAQVCIVVCFSRGHLWNFGFSIDNLYVVKHI